MADRPDKHDKGRPELFSAALFGLCPQCGEKTLCRGLVGFAPQCSACGLDFSRYNVGDGPAALLTLVIGALIVILALVLELNFSPPFWVHAILWIPLTAGAVVGSLRVAKAGLLYLEHRNKAEEGRLSAGHESEP